MAEYYIEQTGEELDGYGVHFFKQKVAAGGIGAGAHIHDAVEVIFVEAGNYQILVNGHEFQACAGDVFLFRANAIHSIYAGNEQENQYYVLKVRPSLLFELSSEKNALGYVLQFVVSDEQGKIRWTAQEVKKGAVYSAFLQMIDTYHGEYLCKDILLKICAGRILYTLLCDMQKTEGGRREQEFANDGAASQIYKAIRYINKNFGSAVDARELSLMVNMSYSYFSRCFKKITGKSFKEYLNEVRINRAEHLLMTTDLSVTEVAMECGYNNVSYFITVYKALKKRTPLCNKKAAEGSFG